MTTNAAGFNAGTHHMDGPAGRPAPPDDLDGSEELTELTAHAAHLRRLSERLDQLTAEHLQLRAHTDDVSATVADLQQRAAEHSDGHPGQAGPPCWASMPAETAELHWHDLAAWIEDVLVPWHETTREQLPDCWALHPPVVVELSWLRHAHRTAYQPDAPAHLAADWHTHWRPAAMRHIHDAIPERGYRSCTPGHHLATDEERTLPLAAIPPVIPIPQLPAGDQPAARRHWETQFQQAVQTDLAHRRARAEGTAQQMPR